MTRPLGLATARVMSALRNGPRYGLDLVEGTGLSSGTVYPTLGRLEKRGLVRGRWEDPRIAEEERRPRRRYYELTGDGVLALEEAVRHLGELRGAIQDLDGGRLAEEK